VAPGDEGKRPATAAGVVIADWINPSPNAQDWVTQLVLRGASSSWVGRI
jgi:hypothetical protein